MKKIMIVCMILLLWACESNPQLTRNREDQDVELNSNVEDTQEILKEKDVDEDVNADDKKVTAAENEPPTDEVDVDTVDDEEVMEKISSIIIEVTTLNVRNAPSSESEKIDVVVEDDIYDILEVFVGNAPDDYWYKININGKIGWIAGWFVSDANLKEYSRISLYEEMSSSSNRVGIVGYSRLNRDNIIGIERIDNTIIYWFEDDFKGQKVYYSRGWSNNSTYEMGEELSVKIGSWSKILTFNEKTKTTFSSTYRGHQAFIKSEDGCIYLDMMNGKIYYENNQIEGPVFELDDEYMAYNDKQASIDLNDDITLIDDQLVLDSAYATLGTHNVESYRVVNGDLSRATSKSIKVIKKIESVRVFTQPFILYGDNISTTMSLKEFQGVKCDAVNLYFDGFNSRKFYRFIENDVPKYTLSGFEEIPGYTTLILNNGLTYKLDNDVKIYESPFLSKGYVILGNSKKERYLIHLESGNTLLFDDIYFSDDFENFVRWHEGQAGLYKLTESLDKQLYTLEIEEGLANVIWQDGLVIFEIGSKWYTSEPMRLQGKYYIKMTGDSIEVLDQSNELIAVYKERDVWSDVAFYYTEKDLPHYKNSHYSLQIDGDGIKIWIEDEKGFILKELFDKKTPMQIKRWSLYNLKFSNIINGRGEDIGENIKASVIVRSQLEEKMLYILLDENIYYLYNSRDESLTELGTSYLILEDYLLTLSKQSDGMTLELYTTVGFLEKLESHQIPFDNLRLLKINENQFELSVNQSTINETTVMDFFKASIKGRLENEHLVLENLNYVSLQKMILLKEMTPTSDVVAELNTDDLVTYEFLKTFQYLNGNIVLWYEIKSDEYSGYAYRLMNESDQFGYSYEYYYVILEDGRVHAEDTSGDCVFYYIVDDLSEQGYLTSYFAWEEGHFGKYINLRNGKTFRTISDPILSEDSSYFLSYNSGYMSTDTQLGIYSIDEDEIINEYEMDINSWQIIDVNWVDNSKVILDVYHVNYKVQKQLVIIKEEGQWKLKLLN